MKPDLRYLPKRLRKKQLALMSSFVDPIVRRAYTVNDILKELVSVQPMNEIPLSSIILGLGCEFRKD